MFKYKEEAVLIKQIINSNHNADSDDKNADNLLKYQAGNLLEH